MPEEIPNGRASAPPGRSRLAVALALVLLLAIAVGASVALLGGTSRPALPGGAQQSAPGRGLWGTLALPAKAAPRLELRNTSVSP